MISRGDQRLEPLRRCEQQSIEFRLQKVQVDAVFENAPDPRGFAGSPRTEQKKLLASGNCIILVYISKFYHANWRCHLKKYHQSIDVLLAEDGLISILKKMTGFARVCG